MLRQIGNGIQGKLHSKPQAPFPGSRPDQKLRSVGGVHWYNQVSDSG